MADRFIFAKIDVELRDHERITGALLHDVPMEWRGAVRSAMLGLFTWCLLYGQAKRLEEGLIARATVHGALNGDQGFIASQLVEVGLLEEFETHYRIRNYAKKNRIGSEIDAARQLNRDRVAASRAKKKDDCNASVIITGNTEVARAYELHSLSLSPSNSLSGSSGGEPERGAAQPRPMGPAVGAMSPPPDTIELDADVLGRCAIAGLRAPTANDVANLLEHARDKGRLSADWKAALVAWVRHKARFEASRVTTPAEPPPAPYHRPFKRQKAEDAPIPAAEAASGILAVLDETGTK